MAGAACGDNGTNGALCTRRGKRAGPPEMRLFRCGQHRTHHGPVHWACGSLPFTPSLDNVGKAGKLLNIQTPSRSREGASYSGKVLAAGSRNGYAHRGSAACSPQQVSSCCKGISPLQGWSYDQGDVLFKLVLLSLALVLAGVGSPTAGDGGVHDCHSSLPPPFTIQTRLWNDHSQNEKRCDSRHSEAHR